MTRPALPLWRFACLLACLASGVAASAQTAPPAQTTWYLAEGATNAFFEEEILIGNPNATAADIEITFLPANQPSVVHTFTMSATSRRTVRVNDVKGLENTGAVSAVVRCKNGLPIVVERTMYWAEGKKAGGHTSAAQPAPAEKWYLAEGATGFFDTFVLIANAEDKPADVEVTFLREDGSTIPYVKEPGKGPVFTLQAGGRETIWVNYQVPGLEATAFSTLVRTTNGTKVFVERAMYFPSDSKLATHWEAGHGSAAVTAPATDWFFGEGYTVDTPGLAFDTFLLLANPDVATANVTVEFLLENEPPVVKKYSLTKTSRESVWVDQVPDREGILGRRPFSIRVRSDRPIVAERAMYWGPQVNGVNQWREAHNSPGVTDEALTWAFAEGLQGSVDATGLPFESYFLIANTSATSTLALRITFLREDGTGIVLSGKDWEVAPSQRFTVPAALFPELSNQRFAAFFESTNNVPFVAERAMYWGAGWYGGTGATGTPFTGSVATPPAPPLPAVTSVSPASGFTIGGTLVTITGTNFRAGSTVTIGNAPATNVVVVNATTIRARTPARPVGPADVVVTAGTVTSTLKGGFTYVPMPQPTITGVSPASGPSSGGTDVQIDGTNFFNVSQVSFGGVPATSFSVVSVTRLFARTPPRTAGKVDVTVSTIEGLAATSASGFEYVKSVATDNIMAFGDSNTEGVIATECAWIVLPPQTLSLLCDSYTDGGYPSRLQGLLRTAYPAQTITVSNRGVGGERTSEGRVRLPSTMTAPQDLVVIMEGINDLNAGVAFGTIVDNLRAMVRTAKNAGKAVMLGTVLPVVTVSYPFKGEMLPYTKGDNVAIEELNRRIRIVAGEESVILVDFWQSFRNHPNMASLFSADGLHPSAAGYLRMAELVRGHVIQQFDGKPAIVP